MTEPLDIKAIYAAAADILEDSGLSRGVWGDPNVEGPVCVGTAILLAAGRPREMPRTRHTDPLFEPLRDHLDKTTHYGRSFIGWNDDPAVSAETIIKTLREIAA